MSVVMDVRSEILEKARTVSSMIVNSEEMRRFRQAEHKLASHPTAIRLVSAVRTLRNQSSQLSLRYGYEHAETVKAKEAYESMLRKVEETPVIEEYQTSQGEVNDLVQGVLKILIVSMPREIRIERDVEEVKSGCGTVNSGCASCRPAID